MAKIIKLEQNIDFFFEKAFERYNEGDFTGCLDFLLSAKKLGSKNLSDSDLSVRLEIADLYSEMGLYDLSLNEYFAVLKYKYCRDEVIYGIIKNFFNMDMSDMAAYYYNFAVEFGAFEDLEDLEPIDLSDFKEEKGLRLVKKTEESEMILLFARQLMGSNQHDYAREILLGIAEDSEKYPEALKTLAILELEESNFSQVLNLTAKILETDPENLDAILLSIIALCHEGRLFEAETKKQLIDSFNETSFEAVKKIANCMAETGDNILTEKYSAMALRIQAYDKDMLILHALSCVNLKKDRAAKNSAVILNTIYSGDVIASFFANKISDAANNNERSLRLTSDIDVEVKKEYFDAMECFLNSFKNDESSINNIFSDRFLYSALNFMMYYGSTDLAAALARKLVSVAAGKGYAHEILVDNNVAPSIKKAFFSGLLAGGETRIYMVFNYQFKEFKPLVPKITSKAEFINAYCQVYSTFALMESSFDKPLNKVYRSVVSAISKNNITVSDDKVIAAVLAYESKINKVFSRKNYACEVFNCNLTEFNKIYVLLKPHNKKTEVSKFQTK